MPEVVFINVVLAGPLGNDPYQDSKTGFFEVATTPSPPQMDIGLRIELCRLYSIIPIEATPPDPRSPETLVIQTGIRGRIAAVRDRQDGVVEYVLYNEDRCAQVMRAITAVALKLAELAAMEPLCLEPPRQQMQHRRAPAQEPSARLAGPAWPAVVELVPPSPLKKDAESHPRESQATASEGRRRSPTGHTAETGEAGSATEVVKHYRMRGIWRGAVIHWDQE
ncbi:hypothetical protein PYCCODRAFT_1428980 [Trametes coccinea BRFM310]|uniref:Uncharacterized protein n=1 Tax=Trametes coccinea (strain BRFM310) TaxID=1353009 RepID=A0A1Y2I7N9_TRAC3|nr:hypothetical protein PYCCODRAFT_1428980 [Trametes coccinea BRFM310]